jgi:hypothetical protein
VCSHSSADGEALFTFAILDALARADTIGDAQLARADTTGEHKEKSHRFPSGPLWLGGRCARRNFAVAYRLRFKIPDPASLVSRTVWLDPCTTMLITPEIEYSLL